MTPVSCSTKKQLNADFPGLGQGLLDCENFSRFQYSSFAISVFDHWLSNEEASNQIANFEGPIHEERNSKRYPVIRSLADDAYVAVLDEQQEVAYYCFESESERKQLIRRSVYDEELITLCLPSSLIVVSVGHDYTDYIYYRGSGEHEKVRSLAVDNGLYCI